MKPGEFAFKWGGFVVLLLVVSLWQAFTIQCVWAWHIVPHFRVAPLPIGAAWAIDTLAAIIIPVHRAGSVPVRTAWFQMAVIPTLVLFIGWVLS